MRGLWLSVSLLFACCTLILVTESAKILAIFTIPAKSQFILGAALLKGLAKRGHEVTMISAFKMENPPMNYRDIVIDGAVAEKDRLAQIFFNRNISFLSKLKKMGDVVHLLTSFNFESENFKAFLAKNEKFDVTIHGMMFNEAFLGLSHKVNSTVIGFSSVGTNPWFNYLTNNPSPYAYVPHIMLPYAQEMTFWQRAANMGVNLFFDSLMYFVNIPLQQRVLKEHFPEAPPLEDLIADVNLHLVNSHFTTESTRPYLSNMIRIGGYHLEDIEELPKDMKAFLDSAKDGAILFSMGSHVDSKMFPEDSIQALLDTFIKLKYHIIWKFDRQFNDLPKNIYLTNWLPQRAVLAHPNIKVFITHAGLGGTVEAVYMGVPMICIPIVGDQPNNAENSVSNGYAIKLDVNTLSENILTESIHEIISNQTYRENIMMKSDLYRNQEMSPMDKAIFWVEHVIKHKSTKHLRSVAFRIPMYQYYMLDVLALFFVCGVIFLLISYFSLKYICIIICKSQKKSISNVGANKKTQ